MPATWSNGNVFIPGAGGLIKSRAGQIGQSVANGSPPLQISLKKAVLPERNDAVLAFANSFHALA